MLSRGEDHLSGDLNGGVNINIWQGHSLVKSREHVQLYISALYTSNVKYLEKKEVGCII